MIRNLNGTLLPALVAPEQLLAQTQPMFIQEGTASEAWYILRYCWKYFAMIPGARTKISKDLWSI